MGRVSYKRLYENEKGRRIQVEGLLIKELKEKRRLGWDMLFVFILLIVLFLISLIY